MTMTAAGSIRLIDPSREQLANAFRAALAAARCTGPRAALVADRLACETGTFGRTAWGGTEGISYFVRRKWDRRARRYRNHMRIEPRPLAAWLTPALDALT